jgi:hypothetical protein
MKTFRQFFSEKKLTPAEIKKREEIAMAIKRDNPNMPMDKKMAIATATAKKVAEDAPVNATGAAIDMNPNGKLRKQDRRSKFFVDKLYRRAQGAK